MSKECKLTVALVIAIAIAIYCATLVTISNFEHGGVITIDTFIGAGVGLIGICATVMVGLQIWNHIEFQAVKGKVNEINATKKEIDRIVKEQQGINDVHMKQMGLAFMLIANESKDIILKSNLLLEGVILTNQSYYKEYSTGKRYDSIVGLLQSLKQTIEACTNYCLDVSYINKLKNLRFPPNHPEYCDMVSIQMDIIKIIEANNQTDINNNAKTKDAQPK